MSLLREAFSNSLGEVRSLCGRLSQWPEAPLQLSPSLLLQFSICPPARRGVPPEQRRCTTCQTPGTPQDLWVEEGLTGSRGSGRNFPSYSVLLLHNASRSPLLDFLDPNSKTIFSQVRCCLEKSSHALSGPFTFNKSLSETSPSEKWTFPSADLSKVTLSETSKLEIKLGSATPKMVLDLLLKGIKRRSWAWTLIL